MRKEGGRKAYVGVHAESPQRSGIQLGSKALELALVLLLRLDVQLREHSVQNSVRRILVQLDDVVVLDEACGGRYVQRRGMSTLGGRRAGEGERQAREEDDELHCGRNMNMNMGRGGW